ncbi:hypothetical protein [Haloglomus litoreum]|nr:hypothetical protein [Haloglomus sp. DT116]
MFEDVDARDEPGTSRSEWLSDVLVGVGSEDDHDELRELIRRF